MATETTPSVIRLTKRQVERLIDREARRRLKMSGREFRRRLEAGELPWDNAAVHDIAMLVKLVSEDSSQAGD